MQAILNTTYHWGRRYSYSTRFSRHFSRSRVAVLRTSRLQTVQILQPKLKLQLASMWQPPLQGQLYKI